MSWRFEGRLCVVVHSAKSPTNLEWQRFLKDAHEHSGSHMRILVVSHGGGPDGDQRTQLARTMSSAPAPTAVMTSSALVRGISAAISFFNRKMKTVDLHDAEGAFGFLGLTASERVKALQLRAHLENDLEVAPPSVRRSASMGR
ncbi:MAG: hypothetical protein QM756_41180 [Polyangiaceae bacterium]